MHSKLFIQAILKLLFGMAIVGLLIFLPAGTLYYFNGWLFMGVLFVPMLSAGIVMMAKCPELLKKRLSAKEARKEQSLVIKLSGLMFVTGFVVSGLNFRFGWYMLPDFACLISSGVFILAYLIYAEVLRENSYLSRTIEVQDIRKLSIRVFTLLSDILCTPQLYCCFYQYLLY